MMRKDQPPNVYLGWPFEGIQTAPGAFGIETMIWIWLHRKKENDTN